MVFPLILMGAFVTSHGDIVNDRVDMWEFIPMELIHELGLAVMAFLGVSVLANLFMMYRRLDRGDPSEEGLNLDQGAGHHGRLRGHGAEALHEVR